jgi:hypothetical protein
MLIQPTSFRGDGWAYDVLYEAVLLTKGVPGLTCEIGLREGGGTELIVRAGLAMGERRHHVAIDPYGSIPYDAPNVPAYPGQFDYHNAMKRMSVPRLYAWMANVEVEFSFFALEDTEFFARFADGVPIYADGMKTVVNRYAAVYFDGPKGAAVVLREAQFFAPRTPVGGVWVFDDTEDYDHRVVHAFALESGFEDVKAGHKWAYQRTKEMV